MANKFCNVCKQPYSDSLADCPNCSTAQMTAHASGKPGSPDDLAPLHLGELSEAPTAKPGGPDIGSTGDIAEGNPGTIELGSAVDPASGASKVSWASLVKEKEDVSEIDFNIEPTVHFDALSDADLLKRAKQPPGGGTPPAAPLPPAAPATSKVEPSLKLPSAGAAAGPGKSPLLSGQPVQGGVAPVAKAGKATQMAPTALPTMLAPEKSMQKVTMMAPGSAPATQVAPQSAGPTMLAGTAGATQLAPPAQPTRLAAPGQAEAAAQDIAREAPTLAGGKGDDVQQDWFDGDRKDPLLQALEGPIATDELARSLLESARTGPEGSAIDLGAEQMAATQALDSRGGPKGTSQLRSSDESSAVDLGSDPNLELPFESASLVPKPKEDQATVDGTEPTVSDDQDHLSRLGREAADDARAQRTKPHYKRRWVGGGIIGLMLGSAACLGLWLTGTEPFTKDRQKQLAGAMGLTGSGDGSGDSTDTPSVTNLVTHLNNGDLDRANKMLEKLNIDDDHKEGLAARGEVKWRNYLARQNGRAPKRNEVGDAITDLNNAGTPQALFWLGTIYELTGDTSKALDSYKKGKAAAGEPSSKRMCEAAVLRLESLPSNEPAADAGARLPQQQLEDQAQALILLLIGLQAAPAGGDADQEAGFKFWEAAKLANQHKYEEAMQAIDEARKLHEKRRFANLRRAQNPTSDPTEEIFLRTCNELKNYWDMRDKLQKGGYDIAKNKGPVAALDKLLQDKKKLDDAAGSGGLDVAKLAKLLDIKEEKPKPEDVLKGVDDLVKAKKMADDQLGVVAKELTDAKYVSDDQKDVVKGLKDAVKDAQGKKDADDKLAKVGKRIEDSGIKEEDLLKGVDQLVDSKMTLSDVAKQLAEAKFLEDAKAPNKQLLEAVNKTIQATYSPLVSALARMGADLGSVGDAGTGAARAVDLSGRLALSQAEMARLKMLQGNSRTPEEMLVFWLPILQNGATPELLDKAAKDVQIVSKDTGTNPDVRALAKCVLSLILWNQGKIAETKKALQESLELGDANQGEWRAFARKTLKELTDPNAYYLPRAEELYLAGRLPASLNIINSGLAVFPNDGQLLALRSMVRLDQARQDAKGSRLAAKDVAGAGQDAAAAIAAGAIADGNFAAGRVAEALQQWDKAEQSFRAALKAHPAQDQVGTRYRLALARVLLQRGTAPAAEPIPAPADRRVGQLRNQPGPRAIVQEQKALTTLVMLLTAGLQVEGDEPAEAPNVDEALKLAEIAIAAKNYEGHLIKAQVLAKKGNYTQALEEYIKGLNYLIQPEYAAGLKSIVDNHPAFKRPDSLNPPDPTQADKYFAAGLRLYYASQYAEAEKQFLESVRYNDQDARYLYFLGLSRLPQGKQTFAIEDFRTGSELERRNRPGPAAVSLSLERVQGPTRQTLNRYRP